MVYDRDYKTPDRAVFYASTTLFFFICIFCLRECTSVEIARCRYGYLLILLSSYQPFLHHPQRHVTASAEASVPEMIAGNTVSPGFRAGLVAKAVRKVCSAAMDTTPSFFQNKVEIAALWATRAPRQLHYSNFIKSRMQHATHQLPPFFFFSGNEREAIFCRVRDGDVRGHCNDNRRCCLYLVCLE